MSCRYKILYTHQKQKKKKTWQDGYLEVHFANKKAIVLSEEFKELDSLFVNDSKLGDDAELESDRYMITVECKCAGDVNAGKENKPYTNNVHNVPKVSKDSTFKRPLLKVPPKNQHGHFSKKSVEPPHPSLCIPQFHQKSNNPQHSSNVYVKPTSRDGDDFMSIYKTKNTSGPTTCLKADTGPTTCLNPNTGPTTQFHQKSNNTHQHSSNVYVKSTSQDGNDFMSMYNAKSSPTTCLITRTGPTTCMKASKGKSKRSTSEILSLFGDDLDDFVDDIPMNTKAPSINRNENENSLAHSLAHHTDISTHNYFRNKCDPAGSSMNKGRIEPNELFGLFTHHDEAPCSVNEYENASSSLAHTDISKHNYFRNKCDPADQGNSSNKEGIGPSELFGLFTHDKTPCSISKNENENTSSSLAHHTSIPTHNYFKNKCDPVGQGTSSNKGRIEPNELFGLFTHDDKALCSVNENANAASSSTHHTDISTDNYFRNKCDPVGQGSSSKERIGSNELLGLFTNDDDVMGSFGRTDLLVNYTPARSVDNLASIDEETDMVDEFIDDFSSTDNCDIFGVSECVEYGGSNESNSIFIEDSPGKPCSSLQNNTKRTVSKDVCDTLPKKVCISYGNIRNLPLQAISSKKETNRGFSVPSRNCRNVQYKFPSKEEVFQKTTPKRTIEIPFNFESVTSYKLIFKSVVNEHINILLFDLAGKYHNALENADVSAIQSGSISERATSPQGPTCSHGPAKMNAVRKEGKNKGRLFYSCPNMGPAQCKFFQWADEYKNKTGVSTTKGTGTSNKIVLNDYHSVSAYFNSHGIQFYFNVKFLRKVPYKRFFKGKKKSGLDVSTKKSIYISLPNKKASSFYGKDDLWIISKSMDFSHGSTFVAKSVFYGPKSNGELEISPLCSYSSPNWQNDELCFAIQAFNAVTELTCLDNIDNFINVLDVPVLPSLLSSQPPPSQFTVTSTRFNLSSLPHDEVLDLVQNTSDLFNLNEDQHKSLQNIADMFVGGNISNSQNVTLIHGVFGAGKSYLLSVVILFLVQLFEIIETRFQLDFKLKLMISSITNVAVDRVLSMLLEHGFDEFIRVGSVRKIAKQILPYSVHACDKDDQELTELNDLLSTELSAEDRGYVKKAIELHKLGVNRKKLSDVRVVGVTCAACVFPFLQNNIFQIQMQDECSQMMEPVSMLPIARFKCQRLILVGDPKQLSPTIQGSEPEHSSSLEMTLFERLEQVGYQPSLLRTQYRCHPSISAICNEMFYDGRLNDGITCKQREPVVDWLPTLQVVDSNDGKEEGGNDGSYFNLKEAEITVRLLEKILKSEIDPQAVGVITQYKSQVWKINSLLRGRVNSSDNTLIKSIQISTVDAFQGAEKDIIILSCVRTRHIGFIDCRRRTNVALSRAKKHLVVVGNAKLLNSNQCWGGVLNVCKKQNAKFIKSNEFLKSLSC